MVTMAVVLSAWPSQSSTPDPVLQRVIAASLSQGAPNTPSRLVRMDITGWGDMNIEFVLPDSGAGQTNRTAALKDVLAIIQAVYQVPDPRAAQCHVTWRLA